MRKHVFTVTQNDGTVTEIEGDKGTFYLDHNMVRIYHVKKVFFGMIKRKEPWSFFMNVMSVTTKDNWRSR